MRYLWMAALAVLAVTSFAVGAEKKRGLDIYFIDTEGGAATLIVTPAGESVLIDCGNPGPRDTDRIYKAAAEIAGLKAIDHLAITHWHTDHYGSAEKLSQLIPIHHFYDRGIPEKLDEDPKNFPTLIQAWKTASKGKSKALRPGDEIPLKQAEGAPPVKLVCLCAASDFLPDKAGASENPIAKDYKPKDEDKTDNAKSLGFLLSYGNFRFLDLGDLTWNMEYKLVHPTDKIGLVDVYQVTHHGLDISNNPVLINTVRPRVAVFNNGPEKGCAPAVTSALRRSPEIKAIYQLHRNIKVASQENTDPEFIANAEEKCQGELIKLSVTPDAKSYSLSVGDKGKPKSYETRK